MPKGITLEETKKLLEKGKADTELLKSMDAIMGLVVFFAPMIAGLPPGTADIIVEVLGEREALIKAGERLIEKLSSIGTGDEVDKFRRIQAAHLLTVYSAFFDSVSENIPGFWKKLALDESTQKYLVDRSGGTEKTQVASAEPPLVPHPLTSFEVHLSDLRGFYAVLSQTLASYLDALKIVNIDAAAKANQYAALRERVVSLALERYQAQYVELAKLFPEFHIFANFRFQVAVDDRLRKLAEASMADRKDVDIGFQKLGAAIDMIDRKPAVRTVDELRKKYRANSQKPIWVKELAGLTFPRRTDIFIPQGYRAVRYKKAMRLDSEETWSKVPLGGDLGPFLARCLESPYAMEKPILILGQPGSGKSMLTHMIGAVLGGCFDTLRVELRNVQADARIYAQIEEFVCQETQGRRVSWPDLRDEFTAPPVVILDGFDELLQATGKVFAGYLQDCEAFQRESVDLDRPVRIMITSRIALVNRAHIPEDTIVIRLEEFDSFRQKKWAEIWNTQNRPFFDDPDQKTQAFDLSKLHGEIRPLARQPLLLLMLAIYDSDHNRLATQEGLNRTALYHNLIRSFVEREEARTGRFEELPAEQQEERIVTEMRRLGVAGLSMYNQRKRDIKRGEIEKALTAFRLTYPVAAEGQALTQADRLFGRFFFVLKAEAAGAASETAYEFLHATFAEFLAAYTIAWEIVETCENIPRKPAARRDYVRKPDSFPDTWFQCMMHAPIFNEPVVLAMLREWLPQMPGANFAELTEKLETIATGQAAMLLEGTRFPHAFEMLPALGHAAIYSANLFTITAVLKASEWVVEEKEFQSYPDETRPWDRLTYLWRSWFSLRVLANLGAIISAKRDGDQIRIIASHEIKETNAAEIGLGRLHTAARGLGDNILLGLSGYFLADSTRNAGPTLEAVDGYLEAEGYSLGVFSEFRKVPLEHSSAAREALLRIVRDERVPHWETWARAIWILTSEPAKSMNWTSFPMIRELRRTTEPLIAPVATPEDAKFFYSEHRKDPLQLIFAKRSQGPKGYAETYKRLAPYAEAGAWSEVEFGAVAEAAVYFNDAATLTAIRAAQPSTAFSFPHELWPLLQTVGSDFVHNADASVERVARVRFGIEVFFFDPANLLQSDDKYRDALKAHILLRFLLNTSPYERGYAHALRMAKIFGYVNISLPEVGKYLLECVGLPADVQIESLDSVRLHAAAIDEEWLKFPTQNIDDITLASLPAARAVARWLRDEEALRELSLRLQDTEVPGLAAAKTEG